ncbi:uncharacterized protein G2W53_009733 [Senna tora]|uniref:Uncharacterized protein n=1 Tax=Senna tora TaxID=362788 RepID=A0A834WYW9_9FABA|nr:uncharacterized protein G2W53_009733 [Senna tora]
MGECNKKEVLSGYRSPIKRLE